MRIGLQGGRGRHCRPGMDRGSVAPRVDSDLPPAFAAPSAPSAASRTLAARIPPLLRLRHIHENKGSALHQTDTRGVQKRHAERNTSQLEEEATSSNAGM